MAVVVCPTFLAEMAPGLCRTVDAYCERTSGAFDAEPLNALTNALMLLAAWGAVRLRRRHPDPGTAGLITAMIVAIAAGGIGAFLFHTTAAVWAVILDMAPFLVFMLLVLWLTLTRFLAWPPVAAAGGLVAFVLVIVAGGTLLPPGMLPGGAYYMLPLVVLAVVTVVLLVRRSPAGSSYLAATVVFALAVAFRQLDRALCDVVPVGTHFLWHTFAALLAFILIRAAILHAPRRDVGTTAG